MSQSKLTINAVDINLNIASLTEINNCTVVEKSLVPDSTNYGSNPSTIHSGGNSRKKFIITGYTDSDNKDLLVDALKNADICVTNLYGAGNSETNLTNGDDYVITSLTTYYKLGNDTVYFNMELTENEVIDYETGGYGYGNSPYGSYGFGV